MRSPGRRTNFALLVLLSVTAVTGVLAFAIGQPSWSRVVVVLHGAAGLGAVLLLPWKALIARRGLRRAGTARRAASLVLALLVLVTIGSGVLHAAGGFRDYLGLTAMQVHVGAALVALPLLVAHLVSYRRRRTLPRRTDVSRRVALRSGALVAGAAALCVVVPTAARRETGSHQVGTDDPAAMPVTQWMFDGVPGLDRVGWRLDTPSGRLDLAALAALPQREVRAVLDCTGGWYAAQDWRGVPLSVLLASVGAGRSIAVVSSTGYRRLLPLADAPDLLLATHVGDAPLSAGHGGPARLVAPGRRGFWWVKWVSRVEVVDAPWWTQPPFPLQ